MKENAIRYWVDYLNLFSNWEHYVPDSYIEKMEKLSKIPNVDDRDFIALDKKYILSVLLFNYFK